ncbi:tyrosine-protein phosphatase [Mesobacterium pallidum]|uniref:tyrosine-protein phosphatase n=1 Tax=Mesobacterium pallidum TaxID=2872037 RepID=UPI001EE39099|nr:tyrosine-protein phosphatase [Mesobacterium pallidum]
MTEGFLNFRAVAPYPATGGRIRQDFLFRSGAFDRLSDSGAARMASLGVTRVFDLRSDGEKARRPSPLIARDGFQVFEERHQIRSGDLRAVLADPASTAEASADEMRAIYAAFPEMFAGVFATCFRTLLAEDRPFAIHCTAGKDRTGLAVALLLDLAGVSRDDIFDDYLRTNEAHAALKQRFVARDQGVDFGEVREEVLIPVISADASYLATALDAIDMRFDGLGPYLSNVVGLDAGETARLRRMLVD